VQFGLSDKSPPSGASIDVDVDLDVDIPLRLDEKDLGKGTRHQPLVDFESTRTNRDSDRYHYEWNSSRSERDSEDVRRRFSRWREPVGDHVSDVDLYGLRTISGPVRRHQRYIYIYTLFSSIYYTKMKLSPP
jgi:hypothetical protein